MTHHANEVILPHFIFLLFGDLQYRSNETNWGIVLIKKYLAFGTNPAYHAIFGTNGSVFYIIITIADLLHHYIGNDGFDPIAVVRMQALQEVYFIANRTLMRDT